MNISSKSVFGSRRSGGALLIVGVLAGVAVGGGAGVFAASSKKTVTVCADKKTNVLRYAKNGKCAKTETKVVLNQTGAKGATGAAGAKGDTGTAGANGTNGTNATVAITQQSICGAGGTSLCKVGMTGPGGGLIFFVDYNDQYAGLDYLEAAPQSCEGTGKTWSSNTANSLVAVNGWAARAVGAGKANSAAMIVNGATSYTADISEAAFFAETSACGSKDDWFLGSLGEMKLMYDNLQGVGGFASGNYWSSSELDAEIAWYQAFNYGAQPHVSKFMTYYVRPVRAF